MRANIPRTPPRPPVAELEGAYLQAMQEISSRLMDHLPAGESLWRILGQAETLLLEAQLQGEPLQTIFGSGGVAGFCQSIMDEYDVEGKADAKPAALERTKKASREPKGGINYRRKRQFTVALATVLILLVGSLFLWNIGILNYWTAGSGFYLNELQNFQSTHEKVPGSMAVIELPLEIMSGYGQTLYADAEGYDVTLTGVETYQHAGSFTDPDTGKVTYQKMQSWYLRLTYSVDASFRRISYVEPPSEGRVIVILADGKTYEGKITWIESGIAEKGREYARVSVIDLPSSMDLTGAVLRVEFSSPVKVEWNRTRVGRT